ncbi:ATPase [Asanoa ishikariensis]|uniref:sensor histidine kinase n=1 Tax=Asanoa ishikariensis TaxID=137265 RepID=UPI000B8521C5|nr:histidine kinase [Asanoa ishikariensis]GIF62203.1 ATPase [Asanoa ishikariensis]
MTSVTAADRLRAGIGRLLRSPGTLPRLSWRSQAVDAGLALLTYIVVGSIGITRRVPPATMYDQLPAPLRDQIVPTDLHRTTWAVLMLLTVVPLVFRRRYPLTMLWVVLGVAPLLAADPVALLLSFVTCIIAGFTAAVHSPYRVPALASLLVAVLFYGNTEAVRVPDAVLPFLILFPILIAADGLRRWKHRADEGRAHLSALERDQITALVRATEHERARIARELHDVVTHHVSVMIVQAGAGRKVLDTAPEQTREALLAIEAGGRAAMTELRHVMGLLTMNSAGPDSAGTADLAPQPGLDRLDALVDRLSDSGVPVTMTRTGQPRPAPAGVELAAYRVVQEALTNTVKHAAGATATVHVEYGADYLRVQVTDTGGGPSASAAAGGGQGLIGLRERLAVYGGTLRAGPRLTGGYRVDAQIPLENT